MHRLSDEFVDVVKLSPMPRHVQARCAGFTQATYLSHVLTRRSAPTTALMRQRLHLLARMLEFPTDRVYAKDVEESRA